MSLEGGAGAILGGIAGFFIGGPAGAWTGAQIGYVAGSALGAEGQNIQGPRLNDLRIQSSAYGKDIPIVYGSDRMSGNIIWGLPLRETETEEDQGKGGGGSTVTTYTYDATFAVLLCEGPITGIRKIWAYGELIYNLSDDASLETIIASNSAARSFTIYTGSETQEPDPLIQADLGAANTQAFRGYAYVVFNRLQLEKYGNRIPELTFEVVGAGEIDGPRFVSNFDLDVTLNNFNRFSMPQFFKNGDIQFTRYFTSGSFNLPNGLSAYQAETIYNTNINGSLLSFQFSEYDSADDADIATLLTDGVIRRATSGSIAEFCGRLDGHDVYSRMESQLIADTETLIGYGQPVNANNDDFSCSFGDITDILINEGETGRSVNCIAWSEDGDFITLLTGNGYNAGASTVTKWFRIKASNDVVYIDDSGAVSPAIPVAEINYEGIKTTAAEVNGNFWHSNAISGGQTTHYYSIDNNNVMTRQLISQPATGLGASCQGAWHKDNVTVMFFVNSDFDLKMRFFTSNSLSADGILLSTIQSDICQRACLDPSDIDVTALTDTVTGYVIPRNMSGRAASEQLMKAYFYDPADINNKITFVKRGGASVATLTEDDLGAHYYGSDFETITHERLQDPELPSEIVIKHIDQNRAYQDGAQRSQRITHPVENISTTELSIVMTATKAKQTAEIWMQNAYTERDKYQFALSRDYIDLNPTDVITVPTGGGNRDLRITKITYAPVMDIEAVADSPYTSDAEAGEGEAIGGNIGLQGPTNLRLLDIPLLRNADNDEGIYLAASGYYDAWTGGQVFSSNNETDGFTSKTSIFNDAVMGSSTTALADGSMYDWDRANTVTIQLTNGELSSITEDQVAQGNNYCILGDEIIQYANATLNGDGAYTLDTLTRGRRGTDWATDTHAIGDRFIFIGALTLKRIEHAYNALKYYRAATFGSFLDEADTQSLTNTGVSLKPFSPVDVKGSRDGSNNLTITWMRRSRYIAPTFRDLPLFEESQSYEVDIMSGSTVLRTISVTAQTASYTAAQQTTDGLTPGSPVTIRVYQLSAIVGRGYKREAII